MQILRDEVAIREAIDSWPDPAMGQLLASRLDFYEQFNDLDLSDLLKVILIEPGDTLEELDIEFRGNFLANYFSGRRFGDPGFKPSFETLEVHVTFFDIFFCEGDEGFGVEVIVPKAHDIDARLLDLCVQFATEPAQAAS